MKNWYWVTEDPEEKGYFVQAESHDDAIGVYGEAHIFEGDYPDRMWVRGMKQRNELLADRVLGYLEQSPDELLLDDYFMDFDDNVLKLPDRHRESVELLLAALLRFIGAQQVFEPTDDGRWIVIVERCQQCKKALAPKEAKRWDGSGIPFCSQACCDEFSTKREGGGA